MGSASAAYVYYQAKSSIDKTYSAAQGAKTAKVSSTKPISILLMGTDTGALGRTYKGRTDTMIVVTINPKTNKTTMVSIPRDTLAKISATSSNSSSTQKNQRSIYRWWCNDSHEDCRKLAQHSN
ncbi:LCP family protein [Secundilactobacillus odoratitofui]|uniref:LCP family protein n=1 Tax=Secundilactobacillus odoratitofui TaxID=480930 RepID=UPI0006CFDCBB|nr:LCP family protein [Secundilactobacillus odoratitofui]